MPLEESHSYSSNAASVAYPGSTRTPSDRVFYVCTRSGIFSRRPSPSRGALFQLHGSDAQSTCRSTSRCSDESCLEVRDVPKPNGANGGFYPPAAGILIRLMHQGELTTRSRHSGGGNGREACKYRYTQTSVCALFDKFAGKPSDALGHSHEHLQNVWDIGTT
ncbi:hypothetical protein OBBRIDRAFT_379584 [Obba rivulosa]|uniref:Uncharacterized protein n=1 Tax=Obba rivulosa TaxID=1052685 RepID=A0A8E2DNH9_9APHY|nr:hypothetical protein OBBRIDRAFT_379584 [Obba rivulosa]